MKRILLVDDHSLFLDTAANFLEGMGFVVEKASNGSEAINVVLSAGISFFDLVMTDLDMPIVNGEQLKDSLKQLGLKCPMVLWSAHISQMSGNPKSGFDLELPKLLDIEELKSQIRKLI